MRPPYRAGVIGCGIIGSFIEDTMREAGRFGLPNGHAACYAAMHDMELVGGADIDPGRREAFAKRWDLPAERVYEDYNDLLETEDLYIVSISTPSPHHTEPALAAGSCTSARTASTPSTTMWATAPWPG